MFADQLRRNKPALGALITVETGKLYQEGLGEVQEMIDICDFAVGLSRQLYGLTMPSERPGHKMAEYWHPMGVVGVDHGVQLSGSGVVLERSTCPGLREQRGLETFRENPSSRQWFAKNCWSAKLRAFPDAPGGLLQVIVGDSEAGKAACGRRSGAGRSAPPAARAWGVP